MLMLSINLLLNYKKMNSELNIFWKNIRKNWSNLFIIVFVVILITAIFTFSQPLKYESSTKLLIVQEYNAEVDPYAASRSTQYLSNLLAQVIQSTSFFEEVMATGFNIEDDFGSNPGKRIKNWNKTVKANAISDSGIIIVNVYHEDVNQADQIAQAVSYVMKAKNSLYHGWGNRVSVRTIERPINSQWPVKPNILFNFVFSIAFGLIVGAGFIYLFPSAKIRLWPKRKRKAEKHESAEYALNRQEEKTSENNWSHLSQMIEKKQDEIMPKEKTIDDLVGRAEAGQEKNNRDDGYKNGNMDQFIR